MRTKVLYLLVAAVAIGAAIAPLGLERTDFLDHPGHLALLLVLSLAGGSRSLRIPRLRVQVTAADIFLFCALLTLSPLAAPLVALVGVLGAQLGAERRPLSIRFVFNLATVTLAATVAAGVYSWFDSLGTELQGRGVGLLAAAAAFVAVNLLLVSVVVRIEKGHAVLTTCRQLSPVVLIGTVTNALVGLGLGVLLIEIGATALLLGLVATAPLVAFYREQRSRIESGAETSPAPAPRVARSPALP